MPVRHNRCRFDIDLSEPMSYNLGGKKKNKNTMRDLKIVFARNIVLASNMYVSSGGQ